MAVIGATGIEPVNFLEQYAKGLQVGAGRRQLERQEIDRIKAEQEQLAVNDLVRANPNFRAAVVQNQLMGMGPAGREALQAGLGLEQARNQMRKQDAEMQAMKFNQYRDRLLPVNDQNGWSAWRTSMIREYSSTIPEIEAMIPEQFSPEAKMNMFATSESMVPMTEYQRRSIAVQEEQNRRLAAGVTGRPSAEPKESAPPAADATELPPKIRAKREELYPKATSAVQTAIRDIDGQIAAAKRLREHPGLDAITGGIQGRMPSFRDVATAAQSEFDTLLAKGTLTSLTRLRAASETGGALGNVSNQDTNLLRDSVGALNQAQGKESFQDSLDRYIADLEFAKENVQNAYNETYAYRMNAGEQGVPSKSRQIRGDPSKRKPSDAAAVLKQADAILGL